MNRGPNDNLTASTPSSVMDIQNSYINQKAGDIEMNVGNQQFRPPLPVGPRPPHPLQQQQQQNQITAQLQQPQGPPPGAGQPRMQLQGKTSGPQEQPNLNELTQNNPQPQQINNAPSAT